MSKKIKTIIWSGVALVVLIAVTIALVLTAPSQSGEGSSNVSVDAIALIRETYSDVAVSYTHLDVYKRQPSDDMQTVSETRNLH